MIGRSNGNGMGFGRNIKSEGKAMIWSRGDESIGDAFPEILEATKLLPDNVCLDGEI